MEARMRPEVVHYGGGAILVTWRCTWVMPRWEPACGALEPGYVALDPARVNCAGCMLRRSAWCR